jgi:hypothetical protein
VGTNGDDKSEYYVQQMPSNLVLLCAHDYAMDGAAVLFADDGVVLQLNEEQIAQLRDVISPWAVTKQLVVRNSTYEVYEHGEDMSTAVGYAANTYFNTNVNVSNVEERILVYLISGLTMENLFRYVREGSITGIHPDITTSSLNNFRGK